jgi:hypothetical protein
VGCEDGPGGGGASGDGVYRVEPPGVLKARVQSRELSPSVDGRDLTALVSGNTEFALKSRCSSSFPTISKRSRRR